MREKPIKSRTNQVIIVAGLVTGGCCWTLVHLLGAPELSFDNDENVSFLKREKKKREKETIWNNTRSEMKR